MSPTTEIKTESSFSRAKRIFTKNALASEPSGPASSPDHWLNRYGDLAYDLASSVLWSQPNGKLILKKLYLSRKGAELARLQGSKLERAAVFQESIQLIREARWKYTRKLTTAEQRMLDATPSEEARLKQFDSYLHRLGLEDQVILLMRDKLGLPTSEISSALGMPESSMALQRSQAYETIADWVWEKTDITRDRSCFLQQSLCSSYWDGTLGPAERERTETHLSGCSPCQEFFRRIGKLRECMQNHPRLLLPAEERGHRIAIEPLQKDLRTRKLNLSEIPFFFRTGAESLLITLGILLAVALVPRFQKLYESSMNQRLDALIASSSEDASAKNPPVMRAEATQAGATSDEFGEEELPSSEDLAPMAAEGDSDLDEPAAPAQEVEAVGAGAGPSEGWRFSLRTSSPRGARSRIIKKLTELGATAEDTPGFGGIEAPGGIQFNLVVDRKWLGDIRGTLREINGPVSGDDRNQARTQNPLAAAEPLKWYRVASKSPLPPGKTRIIIWLSQI